MTGLPETEAGWLEFVRNYARYRKWRTMHPLRSDGTEPGWPDLTLCRPPRLVISELKTERGRVSPAQRNWLADLQACRTLEVYLWRPTQRPEVLEVLT